MIDLDKVRADTPGADRFIELNNAGASLSPSCVAAAQAEFEQLEISIGRYPAAKTEGTAAAQLESTIAELIGCAENEVQVTDSGTRGWQLAIAAFPLKRGDVVLVAHSEYSSNLLQLQILAQEKGIELKVVPSDSDGQICLESLEKSIDSKTKLICLTHVPTNGGVVNPAKEVGQIAAKHQIPYFLDAVQTVGQLPLNVKELQCDVLTGTSRKFLRGPRGLGFLYLSPNILEKLQPQIIDNVSAKWIPGQTPLGDLDFATGVKCFSQYEQNWVAKAGFNAAVRYALDTGIEDIWERVSKLASYLRDELQHINGVTVHDIGLTKCGIVTFTKTGHTPSEIYEALAEKNIDVSVSRLASTPLDMQERNLEALVRASVHYYNSEEEIRSLLRELSALGS